jgi:hypothetical protein
MVNRSWSLKGLIGYLILLGRNGIDVALAYDLISCAPRSTEFVGMVPHKEEKNIVWTLEIVK